MATVKKKVRSGGSWQVVGSAKAKKAARPKKTPTQEQRSAKIAKAIARRVGVVCILCEAQLYVDWGRKESHEVDVLIKHFDSAHESEAAIVALTQDVTTISDIIKKAKLDKADKAYRNTDAIKLSTGRVFHLQRGYDRWGYFSSWSLCGYNLKEFGSKKQEKKKWHTITYKDRCKACIRASVGGF